MVLHIAFFSTLLASRRPKSLPALLFQQDNCSSAPGFFSTVDLRRNASQPSPARFRKIIQKLNPVSWATDDGF
jgi:hypothetical protein